jgi:hypothetical protein
VSWEEKEVAEVKDFQPCQQTEEVWLALVLRVVVGEQTTVRVDSEPEEGRDSYWNDAAANAIQD